MSQQKYATTGPAAYFIINDRSSLSFQYYKPFLLQQRQIAFIRTGYASGFGNEAILNKH
ncbi:hypothetical protein KRR40_31455 [Niabella defluvii]|jgi:hypothetical protein|nr:hypothetical protein KRR40_31455 [Niabella sp. I65]